MYILICKVSTGGEHNLRNTVRPSLLEYQRQIKYKQILSFKKVQRTCVINNNQIKSPNHTQNTEEKKLLDSSLVTLNIWRIHCVNPSNRWWEPPSDQQFYNISICILLLTRRIQLCVWITLTIQRGSIIPLTFFFYLFHFLFIQQPFSEVGVMERKERMCTYFFFYKLIILAVSASPLCIATIY